MSIKKEVASGVLYTAIAKYSGLILQIVITAILARILVPEDYGTFAIAYVFINFFYILSDIGIGPAIIQNQDLDERDISNIFSYTVYLGLIISIIFYFCSWPISIYYHKPSLLYVCQSLCVMTFSYCIAIVPQNLLYKQKRFKEISFATLIFQIISGICSVIAAIIGWGVFALVLTNLVSSVLATLFYLYKIRMRFVIFPRFYSLNKILSFSTYQFLFNVINYFGRNTDKMLIGRFVGLHQLGYYEKSYRLMLLPLQNITFVITPVMLPVFSSLQNNIQELAEKYMKMLKLMAYIGFPLSVILFFCGRELIIIFFGNQWELAIKPFKILALTVGLQILTSSTGSIFQSINRTKVLFVAGCWGAFFMIFSFVLTLSIWGSITAVAIGYFVAQLANTVQCFFFFLRELKYPISTFINILVKPLFIALLVGCTFVIFNSFCSINNMIISIIVKLVLGFSLSLFLTQLMGDYDIKTLSKSIVKR